MINPYVAGGVALLIIIMGWQLKSSISRNGELETLLAKQAGETQEAADANKSCNDTVTELEEKIKDDAERRRVNAAERERILVEREQEILRQTARADELERERDNEIISNEQCSEFTSLNVSRFCPNTGRQLLERSRGPGGNGDTDSGDPGGGLQAAASDTD